MIIYLRAKTATGSLVEVEVVNYMNILNIQNVFFSNVIKPKRSSLCCWFKEQKLGKHLYENLAHTDFNMSG